MGSEAVSRAGGTARRSPAVGSRSSKWTQEPSELTNKAGPGVGRGAAPHSCGGQWAPLAPGQQPSPSSPCLLPGTRTKGSLSPAVLPERTRPLSRSSPKSVNFSKKEFCSMNFITFT